MKEKIQETLPSSFFLCAELLIGSIGIYVGEPLDKTMLAESPAAQDADLKDLSIRSCSVLKKGEVLSSP